MGQISWIPEVVEDGYWMPSPWFTTSGKANHGAGGERLKAGTYHRGLPVDVAALDPGIAELVHALNDAGVKTIGSCENITDPDEDDLPVMIVEFLMESWPTLAQIIRTKDIAYNECGWLVTANPDEPTVMAVLFPADDYKEFLDKVKENSK